MRSERHQKKPWKWAVGIALVALLAGGAAYAFHVYQSLTAAVGTMNTDMKNEPSDKRSGRIDVAKKDPFSVLLLGVDEREHDKGRSDTMIVLTVNPAKKNIKMVNIPRDTYTEIIGRGRSDKINHAYSFGGIDMSKQTVEHLLDMPIDYVAEVNFEGFAQLVDAVGGVRVDNPKAFDLWDYHFAKGSLELDGVNALMYTRMRKDDPEGDFGRQDRQKQVLKAILDKATSPNSFLNYKAIFDALGNNVRTNMTFSEMMAVQADYRECLNHIETLYFKRGDGERKSDGIWYYAMDEDELKEVRYVLKHHLGLVPYDPSIPITTTETGHNSSIGKTVND